MNAEDKKISISGRQGSFRSKFRPRDVEYIHVNYENRKELCSRNWYVHKIRTHQITHFAVHFLLYTK